MILYAKIMTSQIEGNDLQNQQRIDEYEHRKIVDSFADKLAYFIKHNKDCLVSEAVDMESITKRYEVHVLSPEQMQELVREITGKIRLGLPVVF